MGVHSTQFAIRSPQHNLYKPLLQFVRDILDEDPAAGADDSDFIRIAGICGTTEDAVQEAQFAVDCGYHAGLLSLTAVGNQSEEAILAHCRHVANDIPVVGFYLQPAVGGRVLSYSFWRRFCELEPVVAIKMAPFNRYYTWDVVRAVMESGRQDIALYTGNDDNIIADLLTPFRYAGQERRIVGGLLGQWGVWTHKAVDMLTNIHAASRNETLSADWLTRNAQLTDANAALFDAANNFAGCIPGINEVLRRQGLLPSNRCLDPSEVLSPGQSAELDRITQQYPWLIDDHFVTQHLDNWLN